MERAKGVVLTDQGSLAINFTLKDSEVKSVAVSEFSVFELIATEPVNQDEMDFSLRSCLMK